MDLLVKDYGAPGKMSRLLCQELEPGKDSVEVFHTPKNVKIQAPFAGNAILMIAGGTGITPVMQIAAEVLRHPEDPTQMSLIFACRQEGDLLMRSTLDEWAANFPAKFKVHYILSDSWPSDWKYSTGFVDKALFEEYLHEPGEDVYNLMCGPPIMLDRGCTPNLTALGHERKRIFSF